MIYHYLYIFLIFILISADCVAQNTQSADTAAHQLNEVVIVAQENKGVVSSSRIDREAMQHLQPTSIADLLELLPGNISQDPKMGQANTINLRETGTITATGSKSSNDDYAITSLGTLFVVDGSPVNTEGNLGSVIGVDASDPAAKRSTVNKGVDMRTISTDNIESIEVVRGIPSAEYGNLTSGMVNIKRIKRATPFTLRFKADGFSKLFAASKGLALGAGEHTLNVDLNYLDSKSDPRNALENYTRVTALAMPTLRFYTPSTAIVWSMGLSYAGSFDKAKIDPDLNFNKIDEYDSDYNKVMLNTDFNLSLYDCAWLENVVVDASVSYESDVINRRKQVAPSRASIAPSGFDDGDHDVSFLLGEYIAEMRVDNRPLSANLKLKADGKFSGDIMTNGYKVGTEWSVAKNIGDGQVYDLSKPLTAAWTTRPRSFSEIPALHTISWFAEDNIGVDFGSNKLEAQIGLRGMALPGLGSEYYLSNRVYIDPRINAVWNFPVIDAAKPLRFTLGAGWGKTTRMPTLDYLYPQCHYNDVVQFNYYDVDDPVSNSLVNVRTYKVDATNYDLRAATNTKTEVRVGVSWGTNKLSVTYFDECMSNGFRYSPIFDTYAYRKYDATAYQPMMHTVEGLPYVDANILDGFRKVTNGTRIYKRGIEYTLQTQRYMPLHTSLIINGAWFRSTYSNSQAQYMTVSDVISNQPISDRYVGVYDTRDGRVNEQFNTNFMLDTQLPQWGLLFTTSIQCMWYVKTTRIRENGIPTSYLSADDGMLHPYSTASADDRVLRFLIKTYNDDSFRTIKVPTAMYVNLKASKQIGRWLRLSAFVNRMIDYLPDYKSNGLTVRRASDAYFGMEAVLTL